MDAHSLLMTRPPWRRLLRGAAPIRFISLLVPIVLLAALLVGCASSDTGEPASGETTTTFDDPGSAPPDSGDSLGMLAPPGLYDLEGGRTQALGVLAYQDLEGGFWAVVDALPDQSTDGAKVIAVLLGVEDLGVDLEALQGRFVIADGVLADGASVRMAGPELDVDSLQEATDMVVVPADGGDTE